MTPVVSFPHVRVIVLETSGFPIDSCTGNRADKPTPIIGLNYDAISPAPLITFPTVDVLLLAKASAPAPIKLRPAEPNIPLLLLNQDSVLILFYPPPPILAGEVLPDFIPIIPSSIITVI